MTKPDAAWSTKDQIDFWRARFEHYDTQARSQLDRIVQIALVMVTLVLTISGVFLSQHVPQALLASPVALIVLWVIVIRLLHEQLFSVILRAYAEGRMATLVEREDGTASKFLAWSRFADPKLGLYFQNSLMVAVLAIVAIVINVVSFAVVFANMPKAVPTGWTPWIWTEIGTLTVIAILTVVAMERNTHEVLSGLQAAAVEVARAQTPSD